MPNMSPLEPQALTAFEPLFDAMHERMGFIPNSLKTLARKPRLLELFVEFALETSKDDAVDMQLKYLLGLVASTVSGCRYCQAHLSETASRESVDPEKIAQVWLFESSELFSEAERSALRFARDAASQPNAVTAEHYTELYTHYSEEQVVELLAIICLFRWLNCWNDTMATELEAKPMETAERLLSAQEWEVGKHRV
jgi:uncharacterized peroxidase-related enzyme